MAQLSRPYQIGLGAIVVLAAVWLLALRGHSSTSGAGPSRAPSASVPAAKPAAPSSPYHGPAPGVAGLTRAIEKARGAVAASERNAQQLERQSAQASSSSPSSPSTPGTAASSVAPRSSSGSHARHAVSRHATAPARPGAHRQKGHVRPSSSRRASVPAKQSLVEGELKHGRTVIVLFWDSKGADDVAVRHELQAVQSQSTAVHVASAKEVGSFGSFTHAVGVYTTPTMLIILPNGRTSTLTGFTDAYAIRQAISEAREQ
jgi:hypothetical protein